MLKNILSIPNTFDPDDRRRRQVLNTLLIISTMISLMGNLVTINILFQNLGIGHKYPIIQGLLASIVFLSLLWMNRSPRIPTRLVATIFLIFCLVIFAQVDTPAELYNGRSTIVWAIPIVLSAMIFPVGYQFLITLVICLMMLFLTPADIRYAGPAVNYYSMLDLIFITFITWLAQRISNQAIRDARAQAETANRHAGNLQAILNSIADGVLVCDLDGKFISANPALLKMISQEELNALIEKPLRNKLRWQRKLFTITTSPVPEVGTVAVFRDETRRYETERAKDALLATASHELRTPLTAVMNYLEMIQVFIKIGKINTVEFNDYVERAIENMNRLRLLVNNILDQAQIQAGVLELKEKIFNLPTLLEKTRQLLDVLLKQKDLSYSVNIAPNVPAEINGDPDRLHQVLINLIGNAIKFTHQGGIQVKVFLANPENLAIEVTDSGPGIAEEQLPDIFEPFRRSSDYVQREQQGAGLGLSITKEIIDRMGGKISVVSRLGVGSTFRVLLPLQGG